MEAEILPTRVRPTGGKKGWSVAEKSAVFGAVILILGFIYDITTRGQSKGEKTVWCLTLIAASVLICGKKGWCVAEKSFVFGAVDLALALIFEFTKGWSIEINIVVCFTVIAALIALICHFLE